MPYATIKIKVNLDDMGGWAVAEKGKLVAQNY